MSELDYATDEDVEDGNTFSFWPPDALVAPFRAIVSKQAQKAYIGTLLFVITAICMFFVSSVAYGIFYYWFIPQIGLARQVHLQFGDAQPWGTAPLGSELVSQQAYDVAVKLEMPRTPSNLAAGNFMLDLSLFSRPSTPVTAGQNTSSDRIVHSRRPAILTYTSPMVDTASKMSFMPLYVLGWQREAETLRVPMLEKIEFSRGWRNLPASLRLEVHSKEPMQVYSAQVEFRARFTGLRWAMYNWRILSFLVFSFSFWSVSMISSSIAWLVLASIWSTKTVNHINIKRETRGKTPIKEEYDDEAADISALDSPSDSHSPKHQPTSWVKQEEAFEEETKRSYSSDTDEGSPDRGSGREAWPSESGAGTGLESAEARGVQRRRSRLFREGHS